MFLRNYWYVAAWARDLGREPLARIMLNEPVVLFRKRDGTPVALEDRCIHRRLPLSMGRLIGDDIQCHYHGLVFDGTGACIKIPGQERIASAVRVKSYPVVERNQCIFVWMGDPDAPDEIQDPDPLQRARQRGLDHEPGRSPGAVPLPAHQRQSARSVPPRDGARVDGWHRPCRRRRRCRGRA